MRPYQEPAIVRRHLDSSTAGFTNRIINSTQQEPLIFKRNTGNTTYRQVLVQVQAQVQIRAKAKA